MSDRYRTLCVDPPWPLEWTGGAATRTNGRGERHVNHKFKAPLPYRTMSVDAICALPVDGLAESAAHLYLWVPDRWLIEGDGARVVRAWGFEPLRCIIWGKRGFGLGSFPRPQHEAMIVARRGDLPFLCNDEGSLHVWKQPYENGARKHSAKPEGAYDLIEKASPGPYCELFARRARLGDWSYWGDESLGTAELVA